MRVRRTAVGWHDQHLLPLAFVVACLAHTAHSFFFLSPSPRPRPRPSNIDLRFCRAGEVRDVVYRTSRGSRISTPLWAAAETSGVDGTSRNRSSGEAIGHGRGGRGGRDGVKKAKESTKRAALISGPPRLESVLEEELDTIHVFREERPGRAPRAIECYTDRVAIVGGRRYAIGHPCDWAVSICALKDDSSVESVPLDSELMEELIPGLQRELEAEDIHLFATPITLTLQGEFLDEGEEDDEEDEEDDDEDIEHYSNRETQETWGVEGVDFEVLEEGKEEEEEEEAGGEEADQEPRMPTDIDVEGVELIASYWYDNQEYALVKHVDPVFIIARQTPNGYYLLGSEEAAAVKPKVEDMLLHEAELTKGNERPSNAREDRDGDSDGAITLPEAEQPGVAEIA